MVYKSAILNICRFHENYIVVYIPRFKIKLAARKDDYQFEDSSLSKMLFIAFDFEF